MSINIYESSYSESLLQNWSFILHSQWRLRKIMKMAINMFHSAKFIYYRHGTYFNSQFHSEKRKLRFKISLIFIANWTIYLSFKDLFK